MQGSVFLREREWEIMISFDRSEWKMGKTEIRYGQVAVLSVHLPLASQRLIATQGWHTYGRFARKVVTSGKKRRSGSLSEPLYSTKCYVFDWQTVLILPHPPIAALDSHAKHQRWWERLKKHRDGLKSQDSCGVYKSVSRFFLKKGMREGQNGTFIYSWKRLLYFRGSSLCWCNCKEANVLWRTGLDDGNEWIKELICYHFKEGKKSTQYLLYPRFSYFS